MDANWIVKHIVDESEKCMCGGAESDLMSGGF
jgi:hypothetical protein